MLVSGASVPGRIGAQIAIHFGALGARVYLHGVTESEGLSTVAQHVTAAGAPEVRVVLGDLTQPAVVSDLFSKISPDIVVNNAGIFKPAPVTADMNLATYVETHAVTLDTNVAVNMKTAFLVTEAAVHTFKRLKKTGVIVFEGDAFIERYGSYPRNLAAYAASKAFIPSVVRQFAEQHGRDGIRFIGVLNGTIEPPATAPQATIEHMQKEIPLPRELLNPWLGAQSVAEAIDHMVRMDAVNGATLLVDGGRTWTTKEEF